MFRIGTKVRIRDDLTEDSIVGPVGIISEMSDYGNTYAIIDSITSSSIQIRYRLRNMDYIWSAEMFAAVEDNPEYHVGEIVFSHIFEDIFSIGCTDPLVCYPVLCEVTAIKNDGKISIKPVGFDVASRDTYIAERPEPIEITLLCDTVFGKTGDVISAYKWSDGSERVLLPAIPPHRGILYADEYIIGGIKNEDQT